MPQHPTPDHEEHTRWRQFATIPGGRI